jgi:hypothetical protein
MNQDDFVRDLGTLPEVTSAKNFGYTLFFYGDETMTPFVSIADSDNDYDNVSDLNRDGIFRLNIGVSAESYKRLFSDNPEEIDYRQLNIFMPHPHYSAQKFICILNPSGAPLDQTMGFIREAYEIAINRSERKKSA